MFFRRSIPSDAPIMAAAVVSVCAINEDSDKIQHLFLKTIFKELMGFDCDFSNLNEISVEEFKRAMPDNQKRNETIDLMLAVEMLCSDIPEKVTNEITSWANALGINNQGLKLARDLAKNSLQKAQEDFYRTNYFHDMDILKPNFSALEEKYGLKAIMLTVEEDIELNRRYKSLENCKPGTLGRGFWDFYKKHNFSFPGEIGSVNESVSHHDWIHVLADYDNDGMGELEVSAFSTITTDSPGAVIGFLGVLSIYQGGLLKTILEGPPHLGHDLEVPHGIERIADALRRGRACAVDLIMGVDFFKYANHQISDLLALWKIPPKTIFNN